jgi:hypothetical protein
MAFHSMINAVLPIALVILTFFLVIRSRRSPSPRGFIVSMANNPTSKKKFFKCDKMSAYPPGADELGPAFTDSWRKSPRQNSEIHSRFMDNA